jgi:myo-inositol 2-dehydrogenase/D-chiro-inositol 1-dehydrogenase
MGPQTRRLRIAVSGLGRMGARHAYNFLHHTPRADLVAVFSPDPREIAWAMENLEPWGVTIYEDYDKMLKHMELEAVCIATITSVHAEQSIKAIESGKHVLCEKPLSTKLSLVTTLLIDIVVVT